MTANERGSGVDVVHERFPEKKRFYSKCLLLGAIANEAARQLTSFSGMSGELIDKVT